MGIELAEAHPSRNMLAFKKGEQGSAVELSSHPLVVDHSSTLCPFPSKFHYQRAGAPVLRVSKVKQDCTTVPIFCGEVLGRQVSGLIGVLPGAMQRYGISKYTTHQEGYPRIRSSEGDWSTCTRRFSSPLAVHKGQRQRAQGPQKTLTKATLQYSMQSYSTIWCHTPG